MNEDRKQIHGYAPRGHRHKEDAKTSSSKIKPYYLNNKVGQNNNILIKASINIIKTKASIKKRTS